MRKTLRRTCVLAALVLGVQATEATAQTPAGKRIAVFRAAGFPTVDAPAIAAGTLDQALAGSSATAYGSAQALAEALRSGRADVLLLPYGSAFPVEAWPAIRGFVEGGGGLVVLGGAPFAQPVRSKGGAFVPGTRQPTYAHDLLIGPVDVVAKADIAGPATVAAAFGSGWTRALPEPTRTFALTVRLATRKDMPAEHGSEGPKDAVVRPLVHVVDRDSSPRACPLVIGFGVVLGVDGDFVLVLDEAEAGGRPTFGQKEQGILVFGGQLMHSFELSEAGVGDSACHLVVAERVDRHRAVAGAFDLPVEDRALDAAGGGRENGEHSKERQARFSHWPFSIAPTPRFSQERLSRAPGARKCR